MTDVVKGGGDARGDLDRVPVPRPYEATDDGAGISALIEGLQAALAPTVLFLVQIGAIVLL